MYPDDSQTKNVKTRTTTKVTTGTVSRLTAAHRDSCSSDPTWGASFVYTPDSRYARRSSYNHLVVRGNAVVQNSVPSCVFCSNRKLVDYFYNAGLRWMVRKGTLVVKY